MVEVMVAFIVVMIMLLMFTRIVTVSAGMLRRSRETISRTEAFNAGYYKLESADRFQKVGEGTSFSLIQTDADGNSLGGVSVELDKVVLKKFTDGETGLSRYRFAREE